MEILRVPPYNLFKTVTVTSPATEYDYTVVDMADNSVNTGVVTSNSNSEVSIPLSSSYDGQYMASVDGEEVFLDIVRPYVNPNIKGTSIDEITEYSKHEELARAIIDSTVSQGFYYEKAVINATGNGADYLPLWKNVKKILKVYENNVLIFDSTDPDSYERIFEVTEDKTAITQSFTDLINRSEGSPIYLPSAASDWLDLKYSFRGFPQTFDYKLVVEQGYRNIPSDIIRATEMLVEDISCGKLDYFKQYVVDYNTDQFKIKFDKQLFEGTGNILVDKILSKYIKSIRTLGVL